MNKKTLNRVLELKKEAEMLPKELLTEVNYEIYTGTQVDEDRAEVYNDLAKIKENKDKLIRKILGFFSANFSDDSVYYTQLSQITFRPKEGVFNTIHFKNNEAWRIDRDKLLKLLEILENEISEKMNAPQQNLDKSIFSSSLFWTILPIVAGLSFFIGTYKAEYDKSEIEKELKDSKNEIIDLKHENILLKNKIESLDVHKNK